MRPIHTMLILGLAALPMAIFIAIVAWLAGWPAWIQLTIIVFGVLVAMYTGVLCWSAAMGEGEM